MLDKEFNQKRIDHIFHYTSSFDFLMKILKNGFAPSYCSETISNSEYLIPMVSFCNIAIKDVDLYMRYGKYGIGMSINWALKNTISPVIYFHENSPFCNLHTEVNRVALEYLHSNQFNHHFKIEGTNQNLIPENEAFELLAKINNITVPTLQFYKNWKTNYKKKEIITYQEREWRFIPKLKQEKRIITSADSEFLHFKQKGLVPKPHLPEYSLEISTLNDLRYIVIKNEEQRSTIIAFLSKRFGESNLKDFILSGKLLILTDEQISNDF